jgi:hypothetical protein
MKALAANGFKGIDAFFSFSHNFKDGLLLGTHASTRAISTSPRSDPYFRQEKGWITPGYARVHACYLKKSAQRSFFQTRKRKASPLLFDSTRGRVRTQK